MGCIKELQWSVGDNQAKRIKTYESLKEKLSSLLSTEDQGGNISEVLNSWYKSFGERALQNILDKNTIFYDGVSIGKPLDLFDRLLADLTGVKVESTIEDNQISWTKNLDEDIRRVFKNNVILENSRLKEFKREMCKLLWYRDESIQIRSTVQINKLVESLKKVIPSYTYDNDVDSLISDYYKNIIAKDIQVSQEEADAYLKLRFGGYKMIDSVVDLNESIIDYKTKQYRKLASFLKSEGYLVTIQDYQKSGHVRSEYINLLMDFMDDYILNHPNISQSLISAWEEKYSRLNGSKNSILDACNAYLNLKHFDESVKSQCGDNINVDPDFAVEPSKFGYGGQHQLKYSIGKDKSTVSKDWSKGEFADALAETTKEEKLMLATLYLQDHLTKAFKNDSIELSAISIAWGHLAQAVYNMSTGDEHTLFIEDIMYSHDNMSQKVPRALKYLFESSSRRSLQDSLKSLGLSLSDLDILYSIYNLLLRQELTKGDPTVALIETTNLLKSDISLIKHLKQDLIFGIFDRNQPADYLRTRIINGETITETISKSAYISKTLLDHVESMRSRSMRLNSESATGRLREKYNLLKINDSTIEIELDNRKYRVTRVNTSGINVDIFSGDNINVDITPILSDSEQDILEKFIRDLERTEDLLSLVEKVFDKSGDNSINQRFIDFVLSLPNSPEKTHLLRVLKLNPKHLLNLSWGPNVQNAILSKNPTTIADDDISVRKQLIEFINDFLRLELDTREGLETLQLYKQAQGGSVVSLFGSAIRMAHEYSMLDDFFKSENPQWDNFQSFMLKNYNTFYTAHGNDFNLLKRNVDQRYFNPIGNPDWLNQWFSAKATLDGMETSATTKDNNDNSIANFRPTNLAAQYGYYLTKAHNNSEHAAHQTLFAQNRQLIRGCLYDQDLESWDGSKKSTKDANTSELIYSGVMFNFWNRFITKGTVSIMPTVYSDKTSFVNYLIDINKELGFGEYSKSSLLSLSEEECINLYRQTVGNYFLRSAQAILNDFELLFNRRFRDLKDLNNFLIENFKGKDAEKQLEERIKQYNNSHDTKLNIATETHFRYNKAAGCLTINELVFDYATRLFDAARLSKRFETEKINFVKALLDNNISFWNDSVIDGTDISIFEKALHNKEVIQAFKPKDNTLSESEWRASFKEKWFKNGRMVLGYDQNGNEVINLQQLKSVTSITLNPFLEKYFYIDNLVSANLKYAMTGSEVADPYKAAKLNMKLDFDPNKSKNSINEEKSPLFKNALTRMANTSIARLLKIDLVSLRTFLDYTQDDVNNLEREIQGRQLDLQDQDVLNEDYAYTAIGNPELSFEEYLLYKQNEIINLQESLQLIKDILNNKSVLDKYYEDTINRVIATSEGSQYKRNVIWTATRTDVQRNSMTGIGAKTNVAIIKDLQAPVYTPNGVNDTEDADDGSAVINPFQAIMENYGLGANAVGYTNKKPIWHYYDPRTGTCVLLKFATFTLSNGQMRLSYNSEKSYHHIFKKMTNKRWNGKYDLLNSVLHRQESGRQQLNFRADILSNLPNGSNELLYELNGQTYSITDMIEHNGIYYTKEYNKLNPDVEFLVAQVFDENSNTAKTVLRQQVGQSDEEFFKVTEDWVNDNPGRHTIDSLYELHEAMGGIHSQEINSDGFTVYSENSNYAVVGFINNVLSRKHIKRLKGWSDEQYRAKDDEYWANRSLNQDYYEQGLKLEHIGYAANVSAVKRGQFNVLNSDTWLSSNNDDLIYTTLDTAGLGVQMDADHTMDEAEMSEPTQVIASLDAGGYTHDVARQAFEDIGRAVESGLRIQMGEMIEQMQKLSGRQFTKEEKDRAASRIRDIFARDFVRTFKARNITDLSNAIIESLRNEFVISENHSQDEFKLPISDPNLFLSVVIEVTSTLNKKGLKRKYPGAGTVMTPGYKNAQIYHIKGEDLTFDDVLSRALKPLSSYTESTNPYTKSWKNKLGSNSAYFFSYGRDSSWKFNDEAQGMDRYGGLRGFELVETSEPNVYDLHFKVDYQNGKIVNPLTNIEKVNLYLAIRNFLATKPGARLSTNSFSSDPITRGAVSGFKNLEKFGFVPVSDGDYLTFKLNDGNYTGISEKYGYDVDENGVDIPVYTIGALSLSEINKLIVDAYLLDLQNIEDTEAKSGMYFQPTDWVKVRSEKGNNSISLEDVNDYYTFKSYVKYIERLRSLARNQIALQGSIETPLLLLGVMQDLHNNRVVQLSLTNDENESVLVQQYIDKYGINPIFSEDLTKPRILRPQLIRFQYNNGQYANLYDLDIVKDNILNGKNNDIQEAFLALAEEGQVIIDGEVVNIDKGSVVKTDAELLMSNLYKTEFGQSHKSLAAAISEFNPKKISQINNRKADLYLVGSKSLTGIQFSNPNSKAKILPMNTSTILEDNVYKIMMLSPELNEPLFQVGYSLVTLDFLHQFVNGRHVFTDLSGHIIKGYNSGNTFVTEDGKLLVYRNGRVYENKYFLLKASEIIKVKDYEKLDTSWYFDLDTLKQLPNYNPKLIGSIINKIAEVYHLTHLLLNDVVKYENINTVSDVIKSCLADNSGREFYKQSLELASRVLDGISQTETSDIDLFDADPRLSQRKMKENKLDRKFYIPKGLSNTYEVELNNLYQNHINKLKESFKLSRSFAVARIPAQSLQSYMKMKLVGYIPINNNECQVSHWQTLLQGSDYDIDKAYIAGYDFDQNGVFKDWSPLFDYTNEETLRESLTLPTPNKVEIKSVDSGYLLDITNDLAFIRTSQGVAKIKLQKRLLDKIDRLAIRKSNPDSTTDKICTVHFDSSIDGLDSELQKLQEHESYEFPPDDREAIYKNSVQARILLVSGDIKNMPLAYSEIKMKDLQDLSVLSAKGKLIYGLTSMNPATKFIMLKQNMDGKAVIGISAVGEKVFMGLSYYFNEGIRSHDRDYVRHMQFLTSTSRIEGRSSGSPVYRIKTKIADTNWYGIENAELLIEAFNNIDAIKKLVRKDNPGVYEEDLRKLENELIEFANGLNTNKTKADLLISQLLSAATDNAKELILNKINAGKDLAKVYLHLLILGYDIKDITSFMISPAVDTVAKFLEVNMFNETLHKSKVENAIEMARGAFPINKFLTSSESGAVNWELYLFIKYKYPHFLSEIDKIVEESKGVNKHLAVVRYLFNKGVMNIYEEFIKTIKNEELLKNVSRFFDYFYKTELIRQEAMNKYSNSGEYEQDLNELAKVFKDALETTDLGLLFGWNREVPTNYADLLAKINAFERMVDNRTQELLIFDKNNNFDKEATVKAIIENKPYLKVGDVLNYLNQAEKLGILTGFDFHRFMSDNNYLKVATDYYDLIKSQYNILDVIIRSPHYSKALKVYDIAEQAISLNSVKGNIISEMRKKLKADGNYLDKYSFRKLENYAEELLINSFIRQNSDLKFPINHGQIIYNENFDEITHNGDDKMVELNSYERIASFKRWFERELIPLMMLGNVHILDIDIPVDPNSDFIKYITDGYEKGRPIKKLSFSMGNIDKSTRSALRFQKVMNSLDILDENNPTRNNPADSRYLIKDWIMLYNLITTNNAPGNDRFAKLFQNQLDDPNSLTYKYLQYVGEMDNQSIQHINDREQYLNGFGFNTSDALLRMAPTYYRSTVANAVEPIIIYMEHGIPHYKIKKSKYGKGLGVYADFDGYSYIYDAGATSLVLRTRIRNYKEDGVLCLLRFEESNKVTSALLSKDINKIKLILLKLTEDRLIAIKFECK